MDEEKLIKKASRGNRRSQTELYKLYYSYAISVSLRFSSNRDEAQEITHDAFVKMFANLDKYQVNLSFKTWFRKIIVNSSIDHFRKYSNQMSHLEILDHDAEVDDDVLSKMSAEEIMGAIGLLSPAYRMVFSLYVVEGYSHQEVAEQLGISVGTSKSNLAKARNRLKVILQDHLGIKKNIHGKL